MKPDLTVIIPLHNGAATIGDTLTSILLQELAPNEVLVVDDGSSDAGAAIAEAHPLAPRVIRLQSNHGVAYARNTGLAESSSQWVACLDQDDLWLPARWRDLSSLLTSHPNCSALVTDATAFAIEADRTALRDHPFAPWIGLWLLGEGLEGQLRGMSDAPVGNVNRVSMQQLMSGPISKTTSYVLSRRQAVRAGGFAPWLRSGDDWVLLQTLARHGIVLQAEARSCLYRVHAANNSLSTDWPLPMLTAAAGLRFGRGLLGVAEARDPARVRRLTDSPFLQHLLGEAAESRSARGFGDALAAWQLLATDRVDRRLALARLMRGAIKARTPPVVVELRRRVYRRPSRSDRT